MAIDLSHTRALEPNSLNLARNTIFNMTSQSIVAVTAVLLLPSIVKGLGNNRYGLFALALTLFSSFGILELGLGRATTKFVSEYLNCGKQDRLNVVVWTSTSIQVFIGLIGGALLAIFSPAILRGLNLAVEMRGDAQNTLYALAVSIPVVLGSSALRGALEGSQRFDLVNIVKICLNISVYLIPFVAIAFGAQVFHIVFFILLSRIAAGSAYFWYCLYVMPSLRHCRKIDLKIVPSLFKYAGWVAVSSIIIPLIVQVDRFFIAAFVSVGAVIYYAVPYELLNGFWIIPGAVAAVIFPAFSALNAKQDSNLLGLYVRSIKYIMIALTPLVLGAITFSGSLLSFWQGPELASKSAVVLQILLIGVLVNSLGYVPSNLLMGMNRPDSVAKIHIIQLPLYLGLAYFLISNWGILGAAIAFATRVTFEAILLFLTSWRLIPDTRCTFRAPALLRTVIALFILMCALLVTRGLHISLLIRVIIVLLLYISFGSAVWLILFDEIDKGLVKLLVRRSKKVGLLEN
jgi:O-antigen/teichoic acid export membrane protein